MRLLSGDTNIDFIGKMGLWGTLSATVVIASIVLTIVHGLNFGIDFAGGYELQVKFPHKVSETQIKSVLHPMGLRDARVQRFGAEGKDEYLVLVRKHTTLSLQAKTALKASFEKLAGGPDNLLAWSVAESGEKVTVRFAKAITEDQVRQVLKDHHLQVTGISRSERTDQPEYVVNLVSLADKIEAALRKDLNVPAKDKIVERVEFVGPQVGAQLRNQGIMAVVWALFFILLYVAVRFDLYFSPGAIIALIHDVSITVGVFSLFQIEFNLPIIAALLTIVGYSLNDTIVVFDRIRENAVRLRGRELRAMVNTSVNQTLSRTLLTSGTTLLVVVALLVVGGGIIRDFSLALFIGITVGTYSSIYIASPIYIKLRERYGQKVRHDKNVAAA